MPTPPKPFTVLTNEKKSHRTKRELLQRKQGEEALLSGKALAERPETKKNKVAHKEFKRINELLTNIEKNDAIYEVVINRYCMIQSECNELVERREQYHDIIEKLNENFYFEIEYTQDEEKAKLIRSFMKSYSDAIGYILGIDEQVQKKRKMLLEIEKENVMTIKAALQTIPKKQESKKNALHEALGGGKA